MCRLRHAISAWLLLACLVLFLSESRVEASELDESCTVSILNRTVAIQPDGSYILPNTPSNMGWVRARATCVEDGVTRSGQSDYFEFNATSRAVRVPPIVFGVSEPVPESLQISAPAPTLDAVGATLQLTVAAVFSDETRDVTPAAEGTNYTSSNPAVASVDADGLVTAQASGVLLVTAVNEGTVAVERLQVIAGTDSDGDGLPDDWEIARGLDPNDPTDALLDFDQDVLSTLDEFLLGTDPFDPDTDGDTLLDGEEPPRYGTDPALFDTDGDGLSDGLEVELGTDPLDPTSFDLAAALTGLDVTPPSLLLVFSTLGGDVSRQLIVTGTLIDGNTIDLTPSSRGTLYESSAPSICNFGSTDGEIFAGLPGECTITVSNSGVTATVAVSVETFTPTSRGVVEIPGFANDVDVSGDFAYVAAGSTGLQVVDVSDRSAPFVAAAFATPGNANDVVVRSGIAWVADGPGGLVAVDVSEPLAPAHLATLAMPGSAMNVAVGAPFVYVAAGDAGLLVVDASDPRAPVLVSSLDTPGEGVGVAVDGTLAVVADGTAGLHLVDVTDPASPALAGSVDTGNARDVALGDGVVWVADLEGSLTSVDLTNPAAPSILASVPRELGGLLHDVALTGSLAFGADVFFVNGIPIVDVTDPRSPFPRTILDFRHVAEDNGTGIALDESYVYLTASATLGDNGSSGTTRLYVGQHRELRDDAGIAPVVRMTAPADGSQVVAGESFFIAVDASDDQGVFFVTFLVAGEVVFRSETPPYVFGLVAPAAPAQLVLSAEAVDFGGNRATSESVAVTVVDRPSTSVVGSVVNAAGAPFAGATVTTNLGPSGTSDAGGLFRIDDVPVDQGAVVVSAAATVDGISLRGQSPPAPPVVGGFTAVGEIVLRPLGALFPGSKHLSDPDELDLLTLPPSFAVGDFDGDGLADLAAGTASTQISVQRGLGGGTFGRAKLSAAPWPPQVLVAADWNGDGLDDLAGISRAAGALAVFLSSGDGTFAAATTYAAESPRYLATGDLDLDGALDVLVTGRFTQSLYLQNRGDGTFTVMPMEGTGPVVVGDWNGDGNPDVLAGSELRLGRGDGTFDAPLPLVVDVLEEMAAAADVNVDGHLDAVYLGHANSSRRIAVLTGHGDGTFAEQRLTSALDDSSFSTILAVADVDQDGFPDVTVRSSFDTEDGREDAVDVFRGDGSGLFLHSQEPPWRLFFSAIRTLELADVDQDGLADLVVDGNGGLAVYPSRGAEGLAGFRRVVTDHVDVAAGDLNSDGLADFVTGGLAPGLTVHLGQPGGDFEAQHLEGVLGRPFAADFTGDGLLDIYVVESSIFGTFLTLYEGVGDGTFVDTLVGSHPLDAWDAVAADFDGDGLTDLITVSADNDVAVVLRNLGDGNLAELRTFAVGTFPQNVAVADWNGDGRTDVATANFWSADVSLVLSRADGTYAPAVSLAPGPEPAHVAALDADGDGATDLAVLQVLLAAATIAGAPAANAEGAVPLVGSRGADTAVRCLLQLFDDRGVNVAENVTVCRDDKPDVCFDKIPADPPPEVDVATLRIEGEGHGPVTAKTEKAEDGTCTITVPRKADVTISFNADETRDLEAAFYSAEDPELFRPAHQVSVEREKTIRVPAGPYVLSLTDRGWAPDLRLLDAAPGSSHRFRYRQRDGWSVVLRTVADRDGTPVADADIEVRALPGFNEPGFVEPGRDHTTQEKRPRTLLERQSNAGGLAVVSGLRVQVAAAAVRHERFLETDIPAFSSDTGTFRVFEARLHAGGSIAVRVVREELAAVNARCELAPPELKRDQSWGLREALYETQADSLGVCRATRIPAGLYALKVSLPDNVDAYAIQPIVVHDDETSDPTVEMWPMVVTGRVLQGEQGASGYEVEFERNGPFEVDAPFYPAGQATTDDDGNYEMVLWAPGEYLGQVLTESSTAGNFRIVELDGDETVDFRIAEAELEGQVVDDSGTPRPEARLTIKGSGLHRGVIVDEDARFRIPFREESGRVEIQAVADGFHRSEPAAIMIDKGQKPEPVTLVIRRRKLRDGRFVLPSGQPAAGVTVSVHRFHPNQQEYPLESLVTDPAGGVEVPLEPGPLRLFYGGPGCALGSFDLAPIASTESFTSDEPFEAWEEPPFEVRCEPPSHLIVRLVTDDPELRGGAPILLRHGDIVIPPSVLQRHLLSLGLPTTTDGQGQIGLVALAPGAYDVFHGKGTSYPNLVGRYEAAKLASVTLGMNATVEIEVTLDFRLDKVEINFAFPGN